MLESVEPSAIECVTPVTAGGQIARQVSKCYLGSVSACWRGTATDGSTSFQQLLMRYWTADMPPCPLRLPDAISPHGGGGRGIHWYETPTALVGHVAGAAVGFVVPRSEVAVLLAVTTRTDPREESRSFGGTPPDVRPMLADGAFRLDL